MLNLAKSIRVNTRAESSSFACIFSSMALKVLGKLVYFFPRAITQITGRFVSFRKQTYYKLALKLQYHLPVFLE